MRQEYHRHHDCVGRIIESEEVMAAQTLADVIDSLNAEQQQSVLQFIEFLRRKDSPKPLPFLAAAEEFMAEHPELLRRLAQ
jgi:hypothetical protein